MITTHSPGFPRIGRNRRLKFALESYWNSNSSRAELLDIGADLRQQHWQLQSSLDWQPVGDFSFYDQVLDTSFLLGNIPERARKTPGEDLDRYFRVARGRSAGDTDEDSIHAGEMTKWFDTNYHYIVPEFDRNTRFRLQPENLLQQVRESQSLSIQGKPVIIGPLTYLWSGKSTDGSERLDLLEHILPVYEELLELLASAGVEWVQIDEPILVTDLSAQWQQAFNLAYQQLQHARPRILLATYFGALGDNLELASQLPVAGLHVDACASDSELEQLARLLPEPRILSAGIIDGRNIWKADLTALLERLEPLYQQLGERLWLAPSCSLLHVPLDLASEQQLDSDLRRWLSFATQKIDEVCLLARALEAGRKSVSGLLATNRQQQAERRQSRWVHDAEVMAATLAISDEMGQRKSAFDSRYPLQQQHLQLPLLPTTTIGSFPQTAGIRQIRARYRRQETGAEEYRQAMRAGIEQVIQTQEELGLDVLVHGEPERNDMVEYFGEHLQGFAITAQGWVQSYGSRCVKPPILYGDVKRTVPVTVEWIRHARSLTSKPVKGMLTGPVTILNWSFVRDDQPRAETCRQIALAIREEVLDLERAGINIIQIDEAALREGLPLRQAQHQDYLDWATAAFRLCANGVSDQTQIHTHMCYSEFNEVLDAIASLDADVITIENSRSNNELLDVFSKLDYPNAIGPGVYDIHSPNVPAVADMVNLLQQASEHIPQQRLWVNPDCGLKTRRWEEVRPALKNMVTAARQLRQKVVATQQVA